MTRRRAGCALAIAVTALLAACGGGGPTTGSAADRGAALFRGEAVCATCHGADLRGTPMGPPLLDQLYAPGHHPDSAIRAAVRDGVQPHHWDFGPMPQLPHLSADEVEDVIAFVRREQRAEGIE